MSDVVKPINTMDSLGYEPDRTRRFSLSSDPITKGRIAALADIRKFIEGEWGIPVYFIIYGSIIKGRELHDKKESDVDFCIYYDISGIEIDNYISVHDLEEGADYEAKSNRIAAAILFMVRAKMRDQGMSDSQLDNIWIYETSDEKIDNALQKIDLTNPVFANDQELMRIVRMFYFDIGNSFNPWKLKVVKKLEDMGEEGVKLWKHIVAFIMNQERAGDIPEEIVPEYPQTIAEAIAKYSPNSSMEEVRS